MSDISIKYSHSIYNFTQYNIKFKIVIKEMHEFVTMIIYIIRVFKVLDFELFAGFKSKIILKLRL